MISKWRYHIQTLLKQIWVQATLYALLGVAAAFVANFFGFMVPDRLAEVIGGDAVDQLLTIMASSMLAVTTFSVSIMVLAFNQAASGATPRATKLLVEDRTAQTALSSFVGAFLFSVVGVVALSSGFYSNRERVILFALTVLVLLSVVATLIRWISELSRFGRIPNTIERLENAARQALALRSASPRLGCRPYEEMPEGGFEAPAPEIGYVQHIDIGALQECAEAFDCRVRLECAPGTFLHQARSAFTILSEKPPSEDLAAALGRTLTIGRDRTFDQDARFGLIVLSEVASRALSPAVNDPGTAIAIIGSLVRALSHYRRTEAEPEVEHDRLYARALDPDEILHDTFTPIARDGAGLVEVMIRLQKGLAAIALIGDAGLARAAARHSAVSLERARDALTSEEDIARVEKAADWSGGPALTRN